MLTGKDNLKGEDLPARLTKDDVMAYPALRGEIGKEVRDLTREICRSLDIEIVKGHVRPDHVHLLLDVLPAPTCFRRTIPRLNAPA